MLRESYREESFEEFYLYIAETIYDYFLNADNNNLSAGDSFCLKLDDDNLVENVYKKLSDFLEERNLKGNYSLNCSNGEIYNTYSIKTRNNQIIVAGQINGMTDDFLGATIRNDANSRKMPLLMITSHPIDSAISGSMDMSKKGMPFYYESLITDIKNRIINNQNLTIVEKEILNYELDRRDEDVFSDNKSLYEYKDLLSIINSGTIDKYNFSNFRLFSIDGKSSEYLNFNSNQIQKKLVENNKLFEKIDRSIRYGDLLNDLGDLFEKNFIIDVLNDRKNKDLENWSTYITYQDILKQKIKKEGNSENPLLIGDNSITIYGDYPYDTYEPNKDYFVRYIGSQKGKNRKISLLLFDQKDFEKIHFNILSNVNFSNLKIEVKNLDYSHDKKNLQFVSDGTKNKSFHKIVILDKSNKIKYTISICTLKLMPAYLIPTIKTGFEVFYKATEINSFIKVVGVEDSIIFNPSANLLKKEDIELDKQYDCFYNERLLLSLNTSKLPDEFNEIKIKINFSGVIINFKLCPDEERKKVITGRTVLKEKLSTKKSFEFCAPNFISKDSQEFYAKEHLLKQLLLEQKIRDNYVFHAYCNNFHLKENPNLINIDLQLNDDLKQSYIDLLDAYKNRNTIPSLAYIDEELETLIAKYLNNYLKCFQDLHENNRLSKIQEDTLLIGLIVIGEDASEILLSPYHPLNLLYQLKLKLENGYDTVSDIVLDKLNSAYLLPYISYKKRVYKVSEQFYSKEWMFYAPIENTRYMGNKKYVSKLVKDKITEFTAHFNYIFNDINNNKLKINLINLGDCNEVFEGICDFYINEVKKAKDISLLKELEIHIYYEGSYNSNVFLNLNDYTSLKNYLSEEKLSVPSGTSMYDLEGILSKKISCFFHKEIGKNYEYAHITFYEMETDFTSESANMLEIETGLSLDGLISGVPSSKYGDNYRTGFGFKFANNNELSKFAALYNSLNRVSDNGNPFHSEECISTQIDIKAEEKMDAIYDSCNWLVFIEPKVDLDFFTEKEAEGKLLIIHYSDQYSTSSRYDAITVTHKSKQYIDIIKEYLKSKSIQYSDKDISKIINLFNAVNGDWLLRLISSKEYVGANKLQNFSREKISIVAGIKFMLAYLRMPHTIWVPVSMEEMLRVSGGAGLSKSDGILSGKNLGFEGGATSDDLLFVGIRETYNGISVYFYPTEVKTGNNDKSVIDKAIKQALATSKGFDSAFNPDPENYDDISYKINRNFMMQLIISSCKKMKSYHVDDSQDWDLILQKFRNSLLNEDYHLSFEYRNRLGKGAVLSFRKTADTSFNKLKDCINIIEIPEKKQFELILKDVDFINEFIKKDTEFNIVDSLEIDDSENLENINQKEESNKDLNIKISLEQDSQENKSNFENDKNESFVQTTLNSNESPDLNQEKESVSKCNVQDSEDNSDIGIKILFGTNKKTGEDVFWEPNNTDLLFHTNTGIIGTMGTGKTQFTKSLITQLYLNQKYNLEQKNIGILIFDYKGDYNESKTDFVEATNAKVLKPYHLPFNPLSLVQSKVFKPLLPVHTANSFKDTLSKIYNLGPKQQSVLVDCILEAYKSKGIERGDRSTWDNIPPTFDLVYSLYANDDEIKKNDTLSSIMNKLQQFEIFEPDPMKNESLFDLLNGVVVIDLSGYDPDIQNLIVAITLDLFYNQMQAMGSSKIDKNFRQLSKFILVDEADNFMSAGVPSLKKILKEGREFGVGTILSTQFLKHFITGEDDYSKYILTWVVHNVSDFKNSDVDFVFNTEYKSEESNLLYKDIKGLKKHNSIVKIGSSSPYYIEDKPFWKLHKELNASIDK